MRFAGRYDNETHMLLVRDTESGIERIFEKNVYRATLAMKGGRMRIVVEQMNTIPRVEGDRLFDRFEVAPVSAKKDGGEAKGGHGSGGTPAGGGSGGKPAGGGHSGGGAPAGGGGGGKPAGWGSGGKPAGGGSGGKPAGGGHSDGGKPAVKVIDLVGPAGGGGETGPIFVDSSSDTDDKDLGKRRVVPSSDPFPGAHRPPRVPRRDQPDKSIPSGPRRDTSGGTKAPNKYAGIVFPKAAEDDGGPAPRRRTPLVPTPGGGSGMVPSPSGGGGDSKNIALTVDDVNRAIRNAIGEPYPTDETIRRMCRGSNVSLYHDGDYTFTRLSLESMFSWYDSEALEFIELLFVQKIVPMFFSGGGNPRAICLHTISTGSMLTRPDAFERVLKGNRWLSYEVVVFLVNTTPGTGSHWVAWAIDNRTKTVKNSDSLRSANETFLGTMRSILVPILQRGAPGVTYTFDATKHNVVQNDGKSCGPAALLNALGYLMDADISCSARDLPGFSQWLMRLAVSVCADPSDHSDDAMEELGRKKRENNAMTCNESLIYMESARASMTKDIRSSKYNNLLVTTKTFYPFVYDITTYNAAQSITASRFPHTQQYRDYSEVDWSRFTLLTPTAACQDDEHLLFLTNSLKKVTKRTGVCDIMEFLEADYNKLEHDHGMIQFAFPRWDGTGTDAGRHYIKLSPEIVELITVYPELMAANLALLHRYLAHLGIGMMLINTGTKFWVHDLGLFVRVMGSAGDHNHKRISRMFRWLICLELVNLAAALLELFFMHRKHFANYDAQVGAYIHHSQYNLSILRVRKYRLI